MVETFRGQMRTVRGGSHYIAEFLRLGDKVLPSLSLCVCLCVCHLLDQFVQQTHTIFSVDLRHNTVCCPVRGACEGLRESSHTTLPQPICVCTPTCKRSPPAILHCTCAAARCGKSTWTLTSCMCVFCRATAVYTCWVAGGRPWGFCFVCLYVARLCCILGFGVQRGKVSSLRVWRTRDTLSYARPPKGSLTFRRKKKKTDLGAALEGEPERGTRCSKIIRPRWPPAAR